MVRHSRHGFTLIELLIVVSLMAILSAIVLPSASPAVSQHLQAAAEMVASDLGYVRSLAVANGSSYRVVIDVSGNQYRIEHSGANSALDVLPSHPLLGVNNPNTELTVDLNMIPTLSRGGVQLSSAETSGGALVTEIEFGPLGSTTETDETLITFAAGSGSQVRSITIFINPVTGLATIGALSGQGGGEVSTPAL